MLRVLIALLGVLLLAFTALALVWLAGQLLAGLGAFVVGSASVLFRLLWFLVVAGGLGGLVYFVASAWRPAGTAGERRPAEAFAGAASGAVPAAPEASVIIARPDLTESVVSSAPVSLHKEGEA